MPVLQATRDKFDGREVKVNSLFKNKIFVFQGVFTLGVFLFSIPKGAMPNLKLTLVELFIQSLEGDVKL